MTKYFKAGIASVILLALLACETPQDNSIEEARQCGDSVAQMAQAQPSTAAVYASAVCEPLIKNINTLEAGLIGVGLVLVEEQKISSLISVESAVNSGTNPVATSLAFLVFGSQAHVTSITSYATMSQDSGSIELASIVALAYFTNIAAVGGLNSSSTPAQISGYLTTLSTDATNGPPAAQALLAAQQSACARASKSDLCTELTNAVGTNTSSYTTILSNASTYVAGGG